MSQLEVKLVHSVIGATEKQRATVKALGLKKTGSVVTVEDTPNVRGMIDKVNHLLEVKEA